MQLTHALGFVTLQLCDTLLRYAGWAIGLEPPSHVTHVRRRWQPERSVGFYVCSHTGPCDTTLVLNTDVSNVTTASRPTRPFAHIPFHLYACTHPNLSHCHRHSPCPTYISARYASSPSAPSPLSQMLNAGRISVAKLRLKKRSANSSNSFKSRLKRSRVASARGPPSSSSSQAHITPAIITNGRHYIMGVRGISTFRVIFRLVTEYPTDLTMARLNAIVAEVRFLLRNLTSMSPSVPNVSSDDCYLVSARKPRLRNPNRTRNPQRKGVVA